MVSDILGVWIEAFGLIKLTESGVNTFIPGPSPHLCVERDGRESQGSDIA
jgi:hypothetical protein